MNLDNLSDTMSLETGFDIDSAERTKMNLVDDAILQEPLILDPFQQRNQSANLERILLAWTKQQDATMQRHLELQQGQLEEVSEQLEDVTDKLKILLFHEDGRRTSSSVEARMPGPSLSCRKDRFPFKSVATLARANRQGNVRKARTTKSTTEAMNGHDACYDQLFDRHVSNSSLSVDKTDVELPALTMTTLLPAHEGDMRPGLQELVLDATTPKGSDTCTPSKASELNTPKVFGQQSSLLNGTDELDIDGDSADGKAKTFRLLEIWDSLGNSCRNERHAHMKAAVTIRFSDMKDEEEDGSEQAGMGHTADTVRTSSLVRRSETQGSALWRHIMLHPHNMPRTYWDIISLILVIYDSIMIPMGLFDLQETPFLMVMQWLTRVFWSADMPCSLLSGYVAKDGSIDMRPKSIAKRYIKSWFGVDLLVVGVDWLEYFMEAVAKGLGIARMTKVSRVFRILRLIRLLRLARMKEVFGLLMERFDNEKVVIVVDVLKLIGLMAAVGHVLGCVWWAIGSSDLTDKSWVGFYGFQNESLGLRYMMSLRWAIAQFGGGMDEVTPKSLNENIFGVFVYIMCYWSGAVFVSILTSAMTQLYLLGSQNTQHLTVLRRYLTQQGISKGLALRVHRNAEHALQEAQRFMPEDDVQLVALVSEPLRVEIHFEMYSPVISVHPFFKEYIREAPPVMRKVCHSAMSLMSVSEGDIVFHTGETPANPKMFFVHRGSFHYLTIVGERSEILPGNWVSEATLWTRWSHCGSLRAIEDSQLYALDAKEFQTIVCQFQHSHFDPISYARGFVYNLNLYPHDSSDLPAIVQSQSESNGTRPGPGGRRSMFRSDSPILKQ